MLTSKQNYALKIMMSLSEEKVTPVRELISEISISVSYLESLIAVLRDEGLVKSMPGMYGGYALSRSPAIITVADILAAFIQSATPYPVVKALTSVSLRDLKDSTKITNLES